MDPHEAVTPRTTRGRQEAGSDGATYPLCLRDEHGKRRVLLITTKGLTMAKDDEPSARVLAGFVGAAWSLELVLPLWFAWMFGIMWQINPAQWVRVV